MYHKLYYFSCATMNTFPTTVAVSSNGEIIAVGDPTSNIKVVNCLLNKLMIVTTDHFTGVKHVQFGRDDKLLSCGNGNNIIQLHDLLTNTTHTIDLKQPISCAVFNPNGSQIAVCFSEPTYEIRILDATSFSEICKFTGHHDSVEQLFFSRDGSLMISRDIASKVRLGNLKTGKSRVITTARNIIGFCTDNTIAVINPKRVDIVDVHDGRLINQLSDIAFGCMPSISSDGSLLAIFVKDIMRAIRIYNTKDMSLMSVFVQVSYLSPSALAFSENNEFLVSARCDGSVQKRMIGSSKSCITYHPRKHNLLCY